MHTVTVRCRVGLLVVVSVIGGILAVSGGFVGVAVAADTEPTCSEVGYTQNNSNWYEVTNVSQLQCIGDNGLDANYVLTDDIDASGTDQWNDGAGFDPIANGSAFTGRFDGDGHVIANLTIDRPSSSNPVGLFSKVEQAARVEKVVIDGANITGDGRVGGLAGQNDGTVHNVTVAGNITGTKPTNSTNVGALVGRHDTEGYIADVNTSGTVTGEGRVGGLVGVSRGTVTRAHTTVNVTASGKAAGGAVGYAFQSSAINHSNASGTVSGAGYVGGLVGSTAGMVTASSASGDASATSSLGVAGGLVGFAEKNSVINASNASGAVSGNRSVGGLVGFTNSIVTASTAVGDTTSSSREAGGLVGFAGQSSMISRSSASGNVLAGVSSAGGLVGYLNSTVERSTASGDIEVTETDVGGLVGLASPESSITRSNATGTVSGETRVGGLVGWNRGAVNTSYATGGVTGVKNVGGLIGAVGGTVDDTYAAPTTAIRGEKRVGGLVGYIGDDGRVNRSFATGPVRATGSMSGGIRFDSPGSVSGSYWNVETTNQSSSDGGTELTTAQMTGSGALDPGNMDALSDSVWSTTPNTDSVRFYPTLIVNSQTPAPNEPLYAGGNGTKTTPYKIKTWNHLNATRANLGANFTLVGDLNRSTQGYETVVTGATGFKPIGNRSAPFNGSFDGADHVISNLSIDRPKESYVGLFGALGENGPRVEGSVTDLTLADVDIAGSQEVGGLAGKAYFGSRVSNVTVTGRVDARRYVGGSVGDNIGKLTNLTANVTVTATGDDLGGTRAGGLAGINRGTIDRAIATGAVSGPTQTGGLVGRNTDAITNTRATGGVKGDQQVGGLVGFVESGDISNSTATGVVNATGDSVGGLIGTLNGTDITESRSTGTVSGTARVGGLVGVVNNGTITTAYATGTVTGSDQVGGLIGHIEGTNAFVTQSYATGTVTANNATEGVSGGLVGNASAGANVTQSYATGEVRSTAVGAGGLVGVSDGATVNNTTTYWDTNRTTQSSSGGGTALSTEAMIGGDALASMSGLDDTIWSTIDASTAGSSGDGYPVLAALPLDPQILVPTLKSSTVEPSTTGLEPENGSEESGSNDGDDSSSASSSSSGGGGSAGGGSSASGSSGGGGGGGSGSATFLLAETVHTQTLEHSTLNAIEIDFADPVDGLIRVTVVEAPDRPVIESSATVVGAVSITPPRKSTETNATLAFTLNATALEASKVVPANIVVYRIDTAGTVHDPVAVSVTAETSDTVTVAAETSGFSTFVLATTQPEGETEPEAVQSESVTDATDGLLTDDPRSAPESTTEDSLATTEASNVATPGFGPLVALIALLVLAFAVVGRSRDQP